jgi:hypothetical protein
MANASLSPAELKARLGGYVEAGNVCEGEGELVGREPVLGPGFYAARREREEFNFDFVRGIVYPS